MKKLVFLILLFLSIPVFAVESPIDYYKPIYFTIGSEDIKTQLSFKYNLLKFNSNNIIYFSYSHYIFWDVYKTSGPIRENNYNPELFFISYTLIPYFDYIQICPFEHISNGGSWEYSRGINNMYCEVQKTLKKKILFGTNLRFWYTYMHSSNNTDIIRYSGNNRIKFFMRGFSKEVYFKMSTFIWSEVRLCNYETGIKFRIVKDPIAPGFFINYINGYNQSLLDYNRKMETFRGGVILNY